MFSELSNSLPPLSTENPAPRWWGAVIDGTWVRLRSWLPVALLAYFAPDSYVLLSAGRLPSDMLAILVAVVCVTLVLTGVGVASQIHRGRRAYHAVATPM